MYGHGFKAWLVHQRVALRLPYDLIVEVLEEQFNERLYGQDISRFINEFARYYAETENLIIQRLLENPFIHADETQISIRGVNQYVWVFTDGKYVVFKLRETRDSRFA